MTIYYSNVYSQSPSSSSVYTHAAPRPGKKGELAVIKGTVTIATSLATDDKVRLCPMPKGSRLFQFSHQWGDLDSGSALVIDVGQEASDPNAYLSASTQYQSADTTLASGEGANVLTEFSTELLADSAATTQEDHLTMTVTTGASGLAATRTIDFVATIYLP